MIHFVVLHKGKSQMDVVATDSAGHRRRVAVIWGTWPPSDFPPENWPEMVEQEMRTMLAYEAGVEAGRIIP